MSFVNEVISAQDREEFRLEEFDSRINFAVPSRAWVIDRQRGIFLRTVVPSARRNEPGDPEAVWENDFHFCWRGSDLLVQTRTVDAEEMEALPGSVHRLPGDELRTGRSYLLYVRHISGTGAAIEKSGQVGVAGLNELLKDLREALAAGFIGAFVYVNPKKLNEARYATLKLAPGVEVI